MSKIIFSLLSLIILNVTLHSQKYPFQDISLPDDIRIENLISLMTLDEKIDNLSSRPPGIPRLGVRGTRIMEGYHGLALSGPANWAVKGKGEAPTTMFPQAYGLAQMWDPELLQEIASWEAYECRYLAQNKKFESAGLIILSPNADLGRDIRWGRTEECYGEDHYLASKLTVAFVKGLQGNHPKYWKTASLMKHFLANSNENERYINSSNFNERLFREYYSYTFFKGIMEGGSKAFMAAYNKYNNIPCTVHPMLKNIAIEEWGQNGIICTDGGGFRRLITEHKFYDDFESAAAECIKSGINMFLDDYKTPLINSIKEKLISEEDIDIVLAGLLRVLLKLGYLDSSSENPYSNIGIADTVKPWIKDKAKELALKATRKSIVLLKNSESVLPLRKDKIKSIAVIGPNSNNVISDWYGGTPPYKVSILDGMKNSLSNDVKINYAQSNKADSAVIAAEKSDVAIVCIGNHPLSHNLEWGKNHVFSDGREEVDRQAISCEQEDLVKLVYNANPRTILILVSSFPYAINWSQEHIPAILHVTHSSQELGNGIADIIFGIESPAGRLVQTWSRSIEHLMPILEYDITKGKTYMYNEKQPLYEFGFGLTYSLFEYSNISIDRDEIGIQDTAEILFELKNIGDYDSDEVVQLYVSFPESLVKRPIISLKGFRRVHVKSGETKNVLLKLCAEDLSYWDVENKKFVLEDGKIKILIGSSSKDIRLASTLIATKSN